MNIKMSNRHITRQYENKYHNEPSMWNSVFLLSKQHGHFQTCDQVPCNDKSR